MVAGHDEFGFDELRDATQAVLAGAEMIAAGRDRTFPDEDGTWPGTGAIVAALEYATERTAGSSASPSPQIFRHGARPPRRRPHARRRRPARLRSGGGGRGRTRRGDRAHRRHDARAGRGRDDPAPVAIAEDLHSLVLAQLRKLVADRQPCGRRRPRRRGALPMWSSRRCADSGSTTTSSTRGASSTRGELARSAAAAGRGRRRVRRRRPDRRGRRSAADGTERRARRAARAVVATTSRARSGFRSSRSRRATCWRAGVGPRARPRRGGRTDVHRDRELRLRLGRQPDRERDHGWCAGTSSTRTARFARCSAGGRRRSSSRSTATRSADRDRLHDRRRQLEGVRRRDAAGARTPRSTTACSTS